MTDDTLLDDVRRRYEALMTQEAIGTRAHYRIDRELSMLLSELEQRYQIPLLEENLYDFRLQNPQVMALYRQISNSRRFE